MDYLIPYESDEHMLYLTEIAKAYKIYSRQGLPYSKFLGALFREYQKRNNITFPIYYWMDIAHRVYPIEQYGAVIRMLNHEIKYLTKDSDGFYRYKDSEEKNYFFKWNLIENK